MSSRARFLFGAVATVTVAVGVFVLVGGGGSGPTAPAPSTTEAGLPPQPVTTTRSPDAAARFAREVEAARLAAERAQLAARDALGTTTTPG